MAKKITVLQIGSVNWAENYKIPESVSWHFIHTSAMEAFDWKETFKERVFSVTIIDDRLTVEQMDLMNPYTGAHTCFYTDAFGKITAANLNFVRMKMARKIVAKAEQRFINTIPDCFFDTQNGSKLTIGDIDVPGVFQGRIQSIGHICLKFDGHYGSEFKQLSGWKSGIPFEKGKGLELWLEFYKESSVVIELCIDQIGADDQIVCSWKFSEKDMETPVYVDSLKESGSLQAHVKAKGEGVLQIGCLHYRRSHCGMGVIFNGGQRAADVYRDEFISYFNPGDLKPPLNVYFSGHRLAEGFEGYFLMNQLKSPFLLISDPRLEGGAFYLGDSGFEGMIQSTIENTLKWLGFTQDQLILSGLSMGSYGALYYGSKMAPHAIIAGKPLLNLGDIAQNETWFRPGGFPASLDVLKKITGGNGLDEIRELNRRFWSVFDHAPFKATKIAVAYMRNDDYDRNAFWDLLDHSKGKHVTIYGKGIDGRHNDHSCAVAHWFFRQYEEIMRNDFGRDEYGTK